MEIAEKQAKAFAGAVGRQPRGFSHFLMGMDFLLGPSREIVIAGWKGDHDTEVMLKESRRRFLPDATVVFHQDGEAGKELEELAPYLAGQGPVGGKATAYICRDFTCQAPVTDYSEFVKALWYL